MSTKDLIAKIEKGDAKVRGEAWQNAGTAGPDAVVPLADLWERGDMEVARSAKRAIWKIVRYVGRPGAAAEKNAVVPKLVSLLADGRSEAVRRDALWMLSELAEDNASIDKIGTLLTNATLREDARMALERIPGDRSLGILKAALDKASADYKQAVVQSLRARGVTVPGFPCQKLVPTKK